MATGAAGAAEPARPWLLEQKFVVLQDRLRAVKAAWIMGGGSTLRQEWFNQNSTKELILSRVHTGLGLFAEAGVPCPAGLRDAVLAEDFDLGGCLARFGLDWEEVQRRQKRGMAVDSSSASSAQAAEKSADADCQRAARHKTRCANRVATLETSIAALEEQLKKLKAQLVEAKEHEAKAEGLLADAHRALLPAAAEKAPPAAPEAALGAAAAPVLQAPGGDGCGRDLAAGAEGGRTPPRPSLQRQKGEVIRGRLKVVKAAWILGGGSVEKQEWFNQNGPKEELLARMHAGLDLFEEAGVPCPAGFREAVLAEDFDYDLCMQRFGLDWEAAMRRPKPAGGEAAHQGELSTPEKMAQAAPARSKRPAPQAADDAGCAAPPCGGDSECALLVSERFGPRPRVRLHEERSACPRDLVPRGAEVLRPHPVAQKAEPTISEALVAEAAASGLHCAGAPAFLGAIPSELKLADQASPSPPAWRTLLIVGPSGSGKTSLLRSIHACLGPASCAAEASFYPTAAWTPGTSVIEQFAGGFEEAQNWLCAVGLSSVPAWCKPYSALSLGEQYRANVARALAGAEPDLPLVFDEWTSELDRGVARSVCAALRRRLAVRRREGHRDPVILFATCHDDVEAHLLPDVVVRCQAGSPPAVLRLAPEAFGGAPAAKLQAVLRGTVEPLPSSGTLLGRWRLERRGEGPMHVTVRTTGLKDKLRLALALPKTSLAPLRHLGERAGEPAVLADASRRGVWLAAYVPELLLHAQLQLRGPEEIVFRFFAEAEEVGERRAWVKAAQGARRTALADVAGEGGAASEMQATYEARLPERRRRIERSLELSPREVEAMSQRPRDRSDRDRKTVEQLVARVEELIAASTAALGEDAAAEWEEAIGTPVPTLTATCASFMAQRAHGQADGAQETEEPAHAHSVGSSCRGLLQKVGWYVPPDPQALLPGLPLSRIAASAPAFRNDPRKETVEEGLVHLASFVGECDGGLSFPLSQAARLLDDGFDGLCVHAVPALAGRPKDFAIGVILGPSGTGKTALAREHFAAPLAVAWDEDAPALAHFGSLAEARAALGAVALDLGAALRPTKLLSGGERERAGLAWGLAEWAAGRRPGLVVDEFTSLLDREVARAVARGVGAFARARPSLRGLVLLSCHGDIVGAGLLEPDWAFDCGSGQLMLVSKSEPPAAAQGVKRKFPDIDCSEVKIPRVPGGADSGGGEGGGGGGRCCCQLVVRRALQCEWQRFREHHYKDHRLQTSAICFVGTLEGRAVAFTSFIPTGLTLEWMVCRNQADIYEARAAAIGYPAAWGARQLYREHRTVVLPDAQGRGIGALIADVTAHVCTEMGYAFMSTTAHPTYGGYRNRSPLWVELPTSQRERPDRRCGTFSHVWVGAARSDGEGEDPERAQYLRARFALEGSLSGVVALEASLPDAVTA